MKVLVTDRFDDEAYSKLSRETSASKSRSPDLSSDDLTDVEGLLIRSRTQITEEVLKRAPKLRLVITSTSGYDHIDLDACARARVVVMYTPDANAASAAELTIGLVLAVARKITLAHALVSQGNWNREPLMGYQLAGKTYGVVGFGRIGSRVAKIAEAFGMSVLICDPYKQGLPLEHVLTSSDVVSVHVPNTRETQGLITLEVLSKAKPGLLFVNTSRGSVVRDETLIEALSRGYLSGIGLDVFEREPLPTGSPLLGLEPCVLTPHIGATTREAFRAASNEAADKMIAFSQHGTRRDTLPD